MITIDGTKYACRHCVEGHRSSQCTHKSVLLTEIRARGRPSNQCKDCRKSRSRDTKPCSCKGQKTPSSKHDPHVIFITDWDSKASESEESRPGTNAALELVDKDGKTYNYNIRFVDVQAKDFFISNAGLAQNKRTLSGDDMDMTKLQSFEQALTERKRSLLAKQAIESPDSYDQGKFPNLVPIKPNTSPEVKSSPAFHKRHSSDAKASSDHGSDHGSSVKRESPQTPQKSVSSTPIFPRRTPMAPRDDDPLRDFCKEPDISQESPSMDYYQLSPNFYASGTLTPEEIPDPSFENSYWRYGPERDDYAMSPYSFYVCDSPQPPPPRHSATLPEYDPYAPGRYTYTRPSRNDMYMYHVPHAWGPPPPPSRDAYVVRSPYHHRRAERISAVSPYPVSIPSPAESMDICSSAGTSPSLHEK